MSTRLIRQAVIHRTGNDGFNDRGVSRHAGARGGPEERRFRCEARLPRRGGRFAATGSAAQAERTLAGAGAHDDAIGFLIGAAGKARASAERLEVVELPREHRCELLIEFRHIEPSAAA